MIDIEWHFLKSVNNVLLQHIEYKAYMCDIMDALSHWDIGVDGEVNEGDWVGELKEMDGTFVETALPMSEITAAIQTEIRLGYRSSPCSFLYTVQDHKHGSGEQCCYF
ncbi:MAG TPA: hypothetical protein VIY48_03380 [Candidatus Paceibacterota bacterium]